MITPAEQKARLFIHALHQVPQKEKNNFFFELISDGMDVNWAGPELGHTVLMHVISRNAPPLLDALIENGANVDAKNAKGETALTWAAQRGHTAMMQTLLDHGANINAQDNEGATALMAAVEYRHPQPACLLIRAGADTSLKNIIGDTVHDYLDCCGSPGTVRTVRHTLIEHDFKAILEKGTPRPRKIRRAQCLTKKSGPQP